MTSLINSIKAGGRAAVIAVALGAASVVAVPAPVMAQSFSFDFPIAGGGGSFSFGIGRDGVRLRRSCLTDREIRRALREEGWENITFRQERRNRVRVIAEWDRNNRLYSMWVHRCTGEVTDIERVRRRGSRGPGVELEFDLNF